MENLKRETQFLEIASQNNAIRDNYIESKIDNTQLNSKYGEIYVTVYHIVSKITK